MVDILRINNIKTGKVHVLKYTGDSIILINILFNAKDIGIVLSYKDKKYAILLEQPNDIYYSIADSITDIKHYREFDNVFGPFNSIDDAAICLKAINIQLSDQN